MPKIRAAYDARPVYHPTTEKEPQDPTPLSNFPIAERESWGRNRQTKNSKKRFPVTFSLSDVPEIQHFVARLGELSEMRRTLSSDGSRRIVGLKHTRARFIVTTRLSQADLGHRIRIRKLEPTNDGLQILARQPRAETACNMNRGLDFVRPPRAWALTTRPHTLPNMAAFRTCRFGNMIQSQLIHSGGGRISATRIFGLDRSSLAARTV
ncbi:hypothetical protein F5X98DRAFT_385147 [Xylaria grammica]|nr:hypothetical protein F5X98DRAFT_385147 [Xylaria grammica]